MALSKKAKQLIDRQMGNEVEEAGKKGKYERELAQAWTLSDR